MVSARWFKVPAASAGVVPVIQLGLWNTRDVTASPPSDTVAPSWKPEPMIEIGVAVSAGPDDGSTFHTAAAWGGVNRKIVPPP